MTAEKKRTWTQSDLAKFIGISQQAVAELIKEGKIDDSTTLEDALRSYILNLREVAAGRGGGNAQSRLLEARAEDTEMAARLKKLEYAEKLERLVDMEIIAQGLTEFGNRHQREFRNHMEKVFGKFEVKYKVKFEAEDTKDAIESFIERAAEFSKDLVKSP